MRTVGPKKGLVVATVVLLAAACSQVATPAGTPTGAASSPPAAVPGASGAGLSPADLRVYTPTTTPPKVDTSIASVPLSDILFDTFRGGSFPLSRATDAAVEGLRDALKPVYEPRYDPVEGGDWLRDDDGVIGYASPGGAYAYPIKMLNFHEIVNDVIDGVPILVSYCPLCASAVVYNRSLDGQVLVFGNTSALYESDMVMYDHQTGSYWFQVLGEAIVGPLTGRRLTMVPSMTTTWGEWKRLHPDTRILSKDQGLLPTARGNPYDRDSFADYANRLNRGQFAFPVSREKLDGRLRPGSLVLAVEVGGSHRAYELSTGSDWLANDVVAGRQVVVVGRREGRTAAAYFSTAGGRPLTFRLAEGVLEDAETGSRWDDGGLAVSGPLAGTRLEAVPSRTSFWFSVAGALPGIELYAPE